MANSTEKQCLHASTSLHLKADSWCRFADHEIYSSGWEFKISLFTCVQAIWPAYELTQKEQRKISPAVLWYDMDGKSWAFDILACSTWIVQRRLKWSFWKLVLLYRRKTHICEHISLLWKPLCIAVEQNGKTFNFQVLLQHMVMQVQVSFISLSHMQEFTWEPVL